jgi:HD-GYP domain-containing protein (c-di-GMP phosphodiesterase class II)
MSPFEAKDIIVKGRGTDFDPAVVDAFLSIFNFGQMDVRSVAVA